MPYIPYSLPYIAIRCVASPGPDLELFRRALRIRKVDGGHAADAIGALHSEEALLGDGELRTFHGFFMGHVPWYLLYYGKQIMGHGNL